MARSEAGSAADRELTERLAARGLIASGTQYERWRRAGLLPRNERRGAGRGHGSSAVLDPATVEIAAVLARHSMQGRDLRTVVVAWFFEAGRPALPEHPAVPEPPEAAVLEAMSWSIRASPLYRMLQHARSAVSEAQKDDFYATAAGQARRAANVTRMFDPSVVREALIAGREVELPSGGAPVDLVHLLAAIGLGVEEVGAEAFADAISATGDHHQMSAQEWRDAMNEAFISDAYVEAFAALARFDPASAVENAGIESLREARETAIGLAGFGALLLMYGLLMPDTPGLARLREKVNQLGIRSGLINLARQIMHPPSIALAVATCLDPFYSELYHSLSEFLSEGPPLLHLAGDHEHNPEHFMETWISSLNALSAGTA